MTDRPSWGLSEGDAIGPDRTILRALGGGKRSEVFLATDTARDVDVVVKVLRPDQGEGPLRALRRESELVGSLRHPVFPELVDAVLDAEPAHIVLEHIEGPRLSTLVREDGSLASEELTALACQLAGGVRYLHAHGAVHLDVKPANTIMGASPRIVDLGVARSHDAALRVRGLVGTHRFQAPEQHHPERFGGLTAKADVWGVGVTVLFAARGSSPFGPLRDEADERRKLTEEDVAWLSMPPTLGPELAELVRAAMAWEPEDRPTADELAGCLEELVAAPRRRRRLGRLRRGSAG